MSNIIFNLLRGRGSKGRGRGGRMSRGGMCGGRGMIKGFGPPGHGRGRMKDGAMNGLAPMRCFTHEIYMLLSIEVFLLLNG